MKRIIKARSNGKHTETLVKTMGIEFNDLEARTAMTAIRAFGIPHWNALQLICFGCPAHLLGAAWFLGTALGGQRDRVAMLCSKGLIYEALQLLDKGKLGELTRLDGYPS